MATLEDIRKRIPLTREELAERCGVDEATIYRWERGVSRPRPASIRKLAEVLGITAFEVMQALDVDESKKERVA